MSLSINDYENIDFEDSIFATVSRPRLKSDYEATSHFNNIYSLPRGATTEYYNYFNTHIDPTMESSEAAIYEVPRSGVYQDPGVDEEEIYQCFDTMRFQRLKSKDITYV